MTPASGWTIDAADATLIDGLSISRADEGFWSGVVSIAAVLTEG